MITPEKETQAANADAEAPSQPPAQEARADAPILIKEVEPNDKLKSAAEPKIEEKEAAKADQEQPEEVLKQATKKQEEIENTEELDQIPEK